MRFVLLVLWVLKMILLEMSDNYTLFTLRNSGKWRRKGSTVRRKHSRYLYVFGVLAANLPLFYRKNNCKKNRKSLVSAVNGPRLRIILVIGIIKNRSE
jgi:hypothetical protein